MILLSLKFTRKVCTLMLVSARIWLEVSAWPTSKSALKGWEAKRTRCGYRVITPLLGAALAADFKGRKDEVTE